MNDILSEVGETVSVKIVDQGNLDKWGEPNSGESITTANKEGFFEIMSREDDAVEEGTFREGELRAFFKDDETNINSGNRINYNGQDFEITEIIDEPTTPEGSHLMARAKPV